MKSSSSLQMVMLRCLGSGAAFCVPRNGQTCVQHSNCVKDDVFSGKNCDEPAAACSLRRYVTAVAVGHLAIIIIVTLHWSGACRCH